MAKIMKTTIKIIVLILVLCLSACTTFIETEDNIKVDITSKTKTIEVSEYGVGEELEYQFTLQSRTNELILEKIIISYLEISSSEGQTGEFIRLKGQGDSKTFKISLLTQEAFEYLRANNILKAKIEFHFKTRTEIQKAYGDLVTILYVKEEVQ